MRMHNYTSDYSFGARAGIVYLIEFKLVCFESAPSLNILHFRISAGRKGYVSLGMQSILNFAGEELAERHKLSLGMNWAHTWVPGNALPELRIHGFWS